MIVFQWLFLKGPKDKSIKIDQETTDYTHTHIEIEARAHTYTYIYVYIQKYEVQYDLKQKKSKFSSCVSFLSL